MRHSAWKLVPGFVLLAALAIPAAAGDFSIGFSYSSGRCDRPVRYYSAYDRPAVSYYSAYGPSVYTRSSTVIYRDCVPNTIAYNRPLDYERVYTGVTYAPRPVYPVTQRVYVPGYTSYTRVVRSECTPRPRIVYRTPTPHYSRSTHAGWGGERYRGGVHTNHGSSYRHGPAHYSPRPQHNTPRYRTTR